MKSELLFKRKCFCILSMLTIPLGHRRAACAPFWIENALLLPFFKARVTGAAFWFMQSSHHGLIVL